MVGGYYGGFFFYASRMWLAGVHYEGPKSGEIAFALLAEVALLNVST